MKRIISVIIALLCVSPAYAQVDISVSPAGSHGGSSVGAGSPSGPQPRPYLPPVSTPRDRSDDYESFCINDHAGACNFMKRDTLGHWIDREELYTRSALVDKQRELASKEAALDKDLAALRSGGATSGSGSGLGTAASSFGAAIQAKIDATAASKVRTAELGASREKILVEASAAHRAAIDQAVAAADEAISESEVGSETLAIEKSVGSHYLQERLDREYRRADTVEMRIRAEGGPHERDRLILASDGRYALDSARTNLEMGLLERSHYALKLGTRLLDVAIDFAPLMIAVAAPHAVVAVGVAMTLSFAKDYYEARTGRRLLGGEMLTGSERSMAMVGAVLAMAPVVGPSYKALAAASESLAIFAEVSKAAKVEARAGSAVAGEIAGLEEAVNGASRVLDSARKIGWGADELKTLTKSAARIERYGPVNRGILHDLSNPSGGSIADTFRSSSYFEVTTKEPVKLYRVYSDGVGEFSAYWSRTKPTGPLQAQLDAALDPSWGNKASKWTEITIPPGEKFYDGAVSEVIFRTDGTKIPTGRLLGGGNQVYINKRVPSSWKTDGGEF